MKNIKNHSLEYGEENLKKFMEMFGEVNKTISPNVENISNDILLDDSMVNL